MDRYYKAIEAMSADTYIANLDKSGWLHFVSGKEHNDFIERIRTAFNQDRFLAFLALRAFSFDSYECIYDAAPHQNSYYGVINLFAQHSHGLFQPENIQDPLVISPRKNDYDIRVSFVHLNRLYEQVVPSRKSFNQKIWDLIHQALADSGIEERFIELPTIDQTASVVFISPRIYRQAERLNLIPPPGYFSTVRDVLKEYLEEYYKELDD